MPYFSIIIPVYNVEDYLKECVDSILGQSFQDFEMILVDDGSRDCSGKLCDDYAQQDQRVVVVHKENGGSSSARNAGLKRAAGTYVIFLDADDFYDDSTLLERLHAETVKSSGDFILFGYKRMQHSTRVKQPLGFADYSLLNQIPQKDRIKWLMQKDALVAAAYLYGIKRSFLVKYSVFFREELKTGEDLEWILNCLSKSPTLYGIQGQPYIYRIRDNSHCTSEKKSMFWQYRYQAILYGIEYVNQSKGSLQEKEAIYGYLAYLYYIFLAECAQEPVPEKRKEAIRHYKELKWLTKYSTGKKSLLCKWVVMLVGLTAASKILSIRTRQRSKVR